MINAIRAREVEPDVAESLKDLLTSAGMVDVQAAMVSIPAGEWGLELGMFLQISRTTYKDTSYIYNCAVAHT